MLNRLINKLFLKCLNSITVKKKRVSTWLKQLIVDLFEDLNKSEGIGMLV